MRSEIISAAVTQKEAETIRAAARRSGVTTSQFIRDAALRAVRDLIEWEREREEEAK